MLKSEIVKLLFMRKCLTLSLLLLLWLPSAAQTRLASMQIDPTPSDLLIPVSIHLDNITTLPDSILDLVEIINGKQTPLSFQIEYGTTRELHWLLTPSGSIKKRTFELVKT